MSTATLDRPSASDGFTLSRIKEGDMAHAMITLSRQYSRPMDAVIRELATNALESHEAAGHTGPVEITLPGWDDLYLTITDHGLGLGLDDFTDVVGDFAGSTKRHAGQATPNYGIGSKSPYAVCDSFTVTATKDGIRREVLFARLDDGNPAYKIISTAATADPNGVSVRVPVSDTQTLRSWHQAAERVLSWWEEDTFRVEGQSLVTGIRETKRIASFRDKIRDSVSTENVHYIDDREAKYPYVMVRTGTAGYSIPPGFLDGLGLPVRFETLVVEMPRDSIKISPDRESIEDTEGNRDLIYAALDEWAETIRSRFLTKLGAATSSYNLYRSWIEEAAIARNLTGLSYRDQVEEMFGKKMKIALRYLAYPTGKTRRMESRLTVEELHEAVQAPCLVLDELDNRSAGIIAKWRRAHGMKTVYVFTDREDVRPLIDPDELAWVTLADLKAETPSKGRAPAPESLSDTDTVARIWHHSYRSSPSRYTATIGDLKKLIADGMPLVIGKITDYSVLSQDGGKQLDYGNVVALTAPTSKSAKLIEKALGQKAVTPAECRYNMYLREVEGLSDEQKQMLVERATLPRSAVRHAGHLTECTVRDADGARIPRYSAADLEALEPLTALQSEADPVYAQLPGMPAPRLGVEFKHTVALLEAIHTPSELLLKMALRADRMAAGDRRRRNRNKSAGTK
ncbi:ATP-binding protein [Arthrobacter koreensis]|uniref:hypothetical protein n=1 Tax=Arthrobacter koreensis TaxID=199136 RepID=UPI00382A30F9